VPSIDSLLTVLRPSRQSLMFPNGTELSSHHDGIDHHDGIELHRERELNYGMVFAFFGYLLAERRDGTIT